MKFSLAVLALTGVATPIKADTMLRSAAKTLGVGSPARDYGAFPRLFSVRSQRSTIWKCRNHSSYTFFCLQFLSSDSSNVYDARMIVGGISKDLTAAEADRMAKEAMAAYNEVFSQEKLGAAQATASTLMNDGKTVFTNAQFSLEESVLFGFQGSLKIPSVFWFNSNIREITISQDLPFTVNFIEWSFLSEYWL